MNTLMNYKSAHINILLICVIENKKKNSYNHCTFRKVLYLAMIEPYGKYVNILSCGTIEGFQQKHSAIIAFRLWNYK